MQTSTLFISLPETSNHHDHSHHQLVFGFQGRAEFDIQGEGGAVRLGQGCLVPASIDHTFCGVGDNRIVVINVPEERIETHRLFDRPSYFTLDNQRKILLQAVVHELVHTERALHDICGQMLLCAMHNLFNSQHDRRATQTINLDIINQHIALNIHRKIAVEELAALAFLSNSHFHYRFKELTDYTPYQYITQKRLSCAQQLLKEGMAVLHVAAATGFPSQSAFTHTFKQHLGITPARYQNKAS